MKWWWKEIVSPSHIYLRDIELTINAAADDNDDAAAGRVHSHFIENKIESVFVGVQLRHGKGKWTL